MLIIGFFLNFHKNSFLMYDLIIAIKSGYRLESAFDFGPNLFAALAGFG